MSTPTRLESSPRLQSLDALRGFDMLWIMGAESVVITLGQATHWGWLEALSRQLEHATWNGFRAYDLIFPLFLFLAGAGLPFSVARKRELGVPDSSIYWQNARRLLLLVFLGLVYNGLLRDGPDQLRYASVLARIGLAWFFASFIVMNCWIRGQLVWTGGILISYFLVLKYVPVPGGAAGDLSPDGSLVAYLDRHFLPGVLYNKTNDPEGLLSTFPAIATAVLGAVAGNILRRPFDQISGVRKTGMLLVASLGCFGMALAWDPFFPINKALWTSSFVLFAAAWSFLLLGVFYFVIDEMRFSNWSRPFAAIGRNSITIYVGATILPFGAVAANLTGWLTPHLSQPWQAVVGAFVSVTLAWLLLWFLDSKKAYLKV